MLVPVRVLAIISQYTGFPRYIIVMRVPTMTETIITMKTGFILEDSAIAITLNYTQTQCLNILGKIAEIQ
jgi:hypothetical protein